MGRIVDRLTSQAAEDKDPKAVRPDRVGKRRLDPRIVEDRPDPVPEIIEKHLGGNYGYQDIQEDAERYGRDQDRYLRGLTPTEGKSK